MDKTIVTQEWQMISFAEKHGAKVTNEKGELVKTSREYPDAVKCYVKFPAYYQSQAQDQKELYFDGKGYDEWWANITFDFTLPGG